MFPPVIDSSMRSEFVSCPQAFKRRYIDNLQHRGRSIHLHFGGCFASGLEAVRNAFFGLGLDQDTALAAGIAKILQKWGDVEAPLGSAKTLERCCGALEAYLAQYPPHSEHVVPITLPDGKCGSEFSFAIPLPLRHPETGEPLLYSGRFDMLAKMGNSYYIEDDKTTSQLGPSWSQQWRLRAQFTGYIWGARQFGYDIEGAVVRGISILKKSYGHAEVIEQRPHWQIERWYEQLLRDIKRMLVSWREGVWDFNLDHACTAYGGCAYLDLCLSQHPERWMDDFETRVYDPLATQED